MASETPVEPAPTTPETAPVEPQPAPTEALPPEGGNNGANTVEPKPTHDPATGHFLPGNPGKPVGAKHLTTLLRETLKGVKAKDPKTGELKALSVALVEKVVHKAIVEGNERMIQLIWDRLEGKPTQLLGIEEGDKAGIDQIAEFLKQMANFKQNGNTPPTDPALITGGPESLPDSAQLLP